MSIGEIPADNVKVPLAMPVNGVVQKCDSWGWS